MQLLGAAARGPRLLLRRLQQYLSLRQSERRALGHGVLRGFLCRLGSPRRLRDVRGVPENAIVDPTTSSTPAQAATHISVASVACGATISSANAAAPPPLPPLRPPSPPIAPLHDHHPHRPHQHRPHRHSPHRHHPHRHRPFTRRGGFGDPHYVTFSDVHYSHQGVGVYSLVHGSYDGFPFEVQVQQCPCGGASCINKVAVSLNSSNPQCTTTLGPLASPDGDICTEAKITVEMDDCELHQHTNSHALCRHLHV